VNVHGVIFRAFEGRAGDYNVFGIRRYNAREGVTSASYGNKEAVFTLFVVLFYYLKNPVDVFVGRSVMNVRVQCGSTLQTTNDGVHMRLVAFRTGNDYNHIHDITQAKEDNSGLSRKSLFP